MTESIKQWIDKQSEVEAIYEPKYGGKDHSGYNTMMLYEVNGERIDAYANGLTKGIEIAEGFELWKIKIGAVQRITGMYVYPNCNKPYDFYELLEQYLKTLEP